MKSEPIVVVCAADDKYAMPLAVVARSALENLKGDRKMLLFVIDGGITESNKQRITSSLDSSRCKVEFIPKPIHWLKTIEGVFEYFKTQSPVESKYILSASDATYYRLFISELLPKQFDRVIYLDCDLVVKGDLEELWKADFGDNYLLAVQDIWTPYVSNPVTGLPNYKELELSADSKYFNAGVLVINLKKWRMDGVTNKVIKYLQSNVQHIRCNDQGVLNALFAKQWGELDPRWNLTPAVIDLYASWENSPFSEDIYDRLLRAPYIIHFATDRKPWSSRHAPFKDSFFDYVDLTNWSGWRLTFWRRLKFRLERESRKILEPMNGSRISLFQKIQPKDEKLNPF